MTGIITTKEELRTAVFDVLTDAMKAARKETPEKLFTISETARKLGKKYDTVKRMIRQNRIQATTDGRYISQQAIDNYLTGKI